MPNRTQPFLHPAIIRIISDRWFKSKSALGNTKEIFFQSTNGLRLPDAMPALAATIVGPQDCVRNSTLELSKLVGSSHS